MFLSLWLFGNQLFIVRAVVLVGRLFLLTVVIRNNMRENNRLINCHKVAKYRQNVLLCNIVSVFVSQFDN